MHTRTGFLGAQIFGVAALLGLLVVGAMTLLVGAQPIQRTLTDDTSGTIAPRTNITVPTYARIPEDAGTSLSSLKREWADFVKQDSGVAPLRKPVKTPSFIEQKSPSALETTPSQAAIPKPYTAPGLRAAKPDPLADLHTYGNKVGDTIQTAVKGMGDQNALLGAFFADQTKNTSVVTLAEKYEALATALTQIEHPTGFTKNATALIGGYEAAATGLRDLSKTSTNDMYDGLLAYNKKVETFAEAFVPYASLFGAYGVTFSPDEPGGIFTPAVAKF
jgi:hypothetical protein